MQDFFHPQFGLHLSKILRFFVGAGHWVLLSISIRKEPQTEKQDKSLAAFDWSTAIIVSQDAETFSNVPSAVDASRDIDSIRFITSPQQPQCHSCRFESLNSIKSTIASPTLQWAKSLNHQLKKMCRSFQILLAAIFPPCSQRHR